MKPLLLQPCIRCRSPHVTYETHPHSITIHCEMCALDTVLNGTLERCVTIWNDHPRENTDVMLKDQAKTLADATPSRIDRFVCALLQSGRVPGTEADLSEPYDAMAAMERAPQAIVQFCRKVIEEIDKSETAK